MLLLEQEPPIQAAQRVLSSDLSCIAEDVTMAFHRGNERKISIKSSPTYGVSTRYFGGSSSRADDVS